MAFHDGELEERLDPRQFVRICFYPSDLAAIQMDRSGTTRIGRYLLNHSFMIPGLIGVGASTTVGYLLSRVLF